MALTGKPAVLRPSKNSPRAIHFPLRDSDFDTDSVTLRQALAIITTARRQGLDSVKLSKLAAAMGHEAEELGVTPPSTDCATVSILLGEARDAGLPHEAIDRIYQAIDPDEYAESDTSRLWICGSSVTMTPTGRWTDCRDSTVSFPAEALLPRR